MAEQYKVAVIGCGRRSSMHVKAYEFIDRGRVAACYRRGRLASAAGT